jgi:hypothetical protein
LTKLGAEKRRKAQKPKALGCRPICAPEWNEGFG